VTSPRRPRALSLRDLNRATLQRQGLIRRMSGSAADAIARLAGLQAQNPDPPYVALWSRLAGFAATELEGALQDRTVVRATVMRSTIHVVAADDYPAFDVAAAEARVANWRATARRAAVDVLELNARLLEYAHEPRTVEEMEAFLDDVAPDTFARNAPAGVRRAAFRIASAAGGLVHVPPSGFRGVHGPNRYVAWDTWLRGRDRPSPDDALRVALERYLRAYGPASPADFGKWVGQPRVPRVRAAVAALGDGLVRYEGPDGRELIDLPGVDVRDGPSAVPVRFLARWDSVLIGYDARDRILPDAVRAAVVKKNGDFLPTFLVDGFVAGLWRLERASDEAAMVLEPFATVAPATRRQLEAEAQRLGKFLMPDAGRVAVRWE
jgi:hypothetical protein